jgi:hypothetical protein
MRVKSLERAAKTEETRSQARIALDRYRGPLLDAAWDLGDRLDNILERGFLASYGEGDRHAVAISSTLFRLAQYFGWVEIVRRDVQLLRFEGAADTWRTAYFLSLVTRRFATDWYDLPEAQSQAGEWIENYEPEQLPRRHLMLWQEEQRGTGERMIIGDGAARCSGYAAFLDDYEQSFSRLLASLESICRSVGQNEVFALSRCGMHWRDSCTSSMTKSATRSARSATSAGLTRRTARRVGERTNTRPTRPRRTIKVRDSGKTGGALRPVRFSRLRSTLPLAQGAGASRLGRPAQAELRTARLRAVPRPRGPSRSHALSTAAPARNLSGGRPVRSRAPGTTSRPRARTPRRPGGSSLRGGARGTRASR